MDETLAIRELRAEDETAVLGLLERVMGWRPGGAHAAYFRWKHLDNPFGRSPGWVAVDGDEIVGLRVFLRWEFTDGTRTFRAVRAVDTATHPDYRGRGVFRELTTHALGKLETEGFDFVFNTPNEQSKPGYLSMGWQELGRLPVAIKVRTPLALPRLARSRVAAEREPLPTEVGVPAAAALADAERVPGTERAPSAERDGTLWTPRTVAFLRWRYGLEQLGYRAWESPAGGLALFRLRRRGQARELVVGDLLLPPHAERTRTVARLLKLTGADHSLRLAEPGSVEGELAPPGLGPVLTWRALARSEVPPLERWRLSMGDVELF